MHTTRSKLFSLCSLLIVLFVQCSEPKDTLYPTSAISFSQDFFLSIRTEQPFQSYLDTLQNIDLDQLNYELATQNKKLAFWINIYNALVQVKIQQNPETYKNRDAFFNSNNIVIGQEKLSLNTIENGLLRRQKVKENQSFVRKFQVDSLDPRVHFTLNCGATSCPPIAYYVPEDIDHQMTLAEQNFIKQSSKYDPVTNQLTISEIFKWFEQDFGGKRAIVQLMQHYGIVPLIAQPSISYTPYNWDLDLENE